MRRCLAHRVYSFPPSHLNFVAWRTSLMRKISGQSLRLTSALLMPSCFCFSAAYAEETELMKLPKASTRSGEVRVLGTSQSVQVCGEGKRLVGLDTAKFKTSFVQTWMLSGEHSRVKSAKMLLNFFASSSDAGELPWCCRKAAPKLRSACPMRKASDIATDQPAPDNCDVSLFSGHLLSKRVSVQQATDWCVFV